MEGNYQLADGGSADSSLSSFLPEDGKTEGFVGFCLSNLDLGNEHDLKIQIDVLICVGFFARFVQILAESVLTRLVAQIVRTVLGGPVCGPNDSSIANT